jgi:hypothetical protein
MPTSVHVTAAASLRDSAKRLAQRLFSSFPCRFLAWHGERTEMHHSPDNLPERALPGGSAAPPSQGPSLLSPPAPSSVPQLTSTGRGVAWTTHGQSPCDFRPGPGCYGGSGYRASFRTDVPLGRCPTHAPFGPCWRFSVFSLSTSTLWAKAGVPVLRLRSSVSRSCG